MVRLWLILALVAVVFTVYCIVDCALQPATRHRGVPKGVWIVITFIPIVGGLLWLLVGRVRRSTLAARRAPDDDPEFLRAIGSVSDQDERIRRLEEELAQLDAEEPPATPDVAPGSEADGRPTPPRPDDDEPR